MKHCQICGVQFDGATCPNCGEATWIEVAQPAKVELKHEVKIYNASQHQKHRLP